MHALTYSSISRARLIAALVLSIAACLAFADRASAVGQVTYDGCLANDAVDNCFDLPKSPLGGVEEVAVSPDGKSVYAVSNVSGSVSHFFRGGPDGQISYDGCLADGPADGCVDLPSSPLTGAVGVAVSPDGKSVYVASRSSDSIAHFFRGAGGKIRYDGCLNNEGSEGCVNLPGEPLDGANDVAVSPDGKSVYVASASSDSVAHFFRGGPDGQISYDGCLNNDGSSGCVDLPAGPINEADGVAVSPDGESVYVTGAVSDSVAHFFRDGPDGQISYDDCVANDTSQGCTALPVPVLDGAISVAVSPDSKSVYVASLLSGTVSHFFRGGPAGQISFDGCLASAATPGCVDLPGEPLKGATDVTTSPDSQSVYVASQISESVSHFFRDRVGGQISYDGCLNNDGSSGCVDLPADPLRLANGVAVSPDGKSVYASAFESRAVSHMFRAPAPAEPDPVGDQTPDPVGDQNPDPVGQPQADTTAPDTFIKKAPKRKTAKTRARIRFASTEAGSTFECSLDRKGFKPCSSPLRVAKLRPAKHRLAVRAIDAAGNVDQTPAKVRWRIEN